MSASLASHKLSPDDWGFAPSINEAAIALAERGLVHTVSVSVRRPFAGYRAEQLRELQEEKQLRVALHLDFSYAGCGIKRRDLFWGSVAIESELREQLERLKALGLRLDSLNGHRHVHLYPAVLDVVQSLGVPLRLPADFSHLGSCVAGVLAGRQKGVSWERTGYLRERDLKNPRFFRNKVSNFSQLLCHPAMHDDFDQVAMDDPLRSGRVREYRKLMQYVSEIGSGRAL